MTRDLEPAEVGLAEEREAGGEEIAGISEWQYAPPPTVYDQVRDNLAMRLMRRTFHAIERQVMRHYHGLQVKPRATLETAGPSILAANHSSHLDTLAVFAALPRGKTNSLCAAAARDYFFAHPLPALVARLLVNAIPLEREGDPRQGLRVCADKLAQGNSVLVFPEGSRTRSGEMGVFKPGVVLLARRCKVPVVPVYLAGTFESLPPWRLVPRGRRISVRYGPPIDYGSDALRSLKLPDAAKHLQGAVAALAMENVP